MQRCIILLAALVATVAATGCAPTRVRSLVNVEIRLAHIFKEPGLLRIRNPVDGERLYMQHTPILTQDDIIEAKYFESERKSLKQQEDGKYTVVTDTTPGVGFRISWFAARRLSAARKKHSRKVNFFGSEKKIAPYLVILVDERVVAVVPVKGKVPRKMLIHRGLTREEAQELADALAGRAQPERRFPSDW